MIDIGQLCYIIGKVRGLGIVQKRSRGFGGSISSSGQWHIGHISPRVNHQYSIPGMIPKRIPITKAHILNLRTVFTFWQQSGQNLFAMCYTYT